jgi:hypothetical protein
MARILTAILFTIVLPVAALAASGWKQQTASLRECTEIVDVMIVPHGFFIRHLDEFVPHHTVRTSADGRFWRCVAAGRTDLLVPASAY